MRKRYIFLLLPVTFILAAFSFKPTTGNDNIIDRIAQQLHKFYNLFPQEKIYIHQDKSLYTLGETIWFKAYLTKPKNVTDTLSTVAYADLITSDNKILFTRKLKVKSGVAPGDFYLPDTLAEGVYQIRAYTNWMRNFDHEYFFSREIRVSSPNILDTKASIAFQTRPYQGGDSVLVTLQLYKHPYEPVKQRKLKLQLIADGKTLRRGNIETDHEGIARISLSVEQAKLNSMGEAMLHVQSDDKQDNFKSVYRLPVGRKNLDLQFFPEGGYLIAGITSKVAFKAVDITGKGTEVAGAVYDSSGNKITDFKSEHLGMGVLTLTPEQNQTYVAKITLPDGSLKEFKLPQPKHEGVALQVSRLNEHTVSFRITNNLSEKRLAGPMYLVAHAEDSVIFAIRASTDKRQLESAIPATRFPAGLIHFTLFDHTGLPLCERLAFVNNPPKLRLSISTNKAVYGQREKVSMLIEAKDETGNPVEGNFSLAVRDAVSTPGHTLNEENIYTSFYLSSELKGNIEQPAYYFDKTQPQATRHLDLLLLTQGWRRFNWNDILQDKLPSLTHALEQSISFSGHVEKEHGKKKPQKSNITVLLRPYAPKNVALNLVEPTVINTETGPEGNFHFVGLNFEDTLSVFIQAHAAKGGKFQVIKRDIISPPAPNFLTTEGQSALPGQSESYLTRMSDWAKAEKQYRLASGTTLLKQVDVSTRKQEYDNPYRTHLKEFVDATVNVAESKNFFSNPLQYLEGRIAGVHISGSGNDMKVFIRGADSTPLLLLDGMRVNLETINNMDASDIEFIEVLKGANAAVYGFSSGSGVIAFYTKRHNPNYDYSKESVPGVISFKLPGYYKAAEFYVPRYDVPEDRHNLPDYRNTLHWQHSVTTDASGKAHITFFTSDVMTEFIAVCEGISKNGVVGTAEYKFSSQRKQQ